MHSNLPTTKPAYSPPGSRPSSEPSASAPGSRPSSEPTASPPRNPPSYDELFAVPFEDDPPPPYECVPEYKDGSSHQLSKRESKGNGSETCVWLDMGAPKPRYEPVPWMLPKDLHLQHGLKCAAYIPGREPELEVRCSIDPNEKTHKFNQLKVTAKLSNDFLAGTNADISLGASNTTEDIKLFDDAAAGSEATKDVPLQKFWKTDEVPLSSLTHVAFDVRQTSIASNQFKLHSKFTYLLPINVL